MSACMIGLGLGQLVAGPLSDRLGRRLPLLVGVAAFAVLSAVCAVAPTIELLLVARFLQGLAGSAGIVICLAIARDQFEGIELSRMLSLLFLVSGTAPIIAPVVGGQLARIMDWRGIFGVLSGIGVILLLVVVFLLPETLRPERATAEASACCGRTPAPCWATGSSPRSCAPPPVRAWRSSPISRCRRSCCRTSSASARRASVSPSPPAPWRASSAVSRAAWSCAASAPSACTSAGSRRHSSRPRPSSSWRSAGRGWRRGGGTRRVHAVRGPRRPERPDTRPRASRRQGGDGVRAARHVVVPVRPGARPGRRRDRGHERRHDGGHHDPGRRRRGDRGLGLRPPAARE